MDRLPELRFLLRKLEIIERSFRAREQKEGFNIFSVLRNESDEVNLHTVFLFELLYPAGSHGMGSSFLKHFFRLNGVPQPTNETSLIVKREKRSAFGQIDIRIESWPHILIIENKINAGDGEKQLERYFDDAKSRGFREENIHLRYLTLHGDDPSRESLGRLEVGKEVTCISYVRDVLDWLAECIRDAALCPPLRETLLQYRNLINKLTGNSMSEEKINEIAELLAEENNAILAKNIIDVWPHLKWRTTWKFLNELETKLKELQAVCPSFEITSLEGWGYNDKDMHQMFFNKRPGEIGFGIAALLFRVPNANKTGLCLGVGYTRQERLYIGLFLCESGIHLKSHDDPRFRSYAESLCRFPQHQPNKIWLNLKSISCRQIDFFRFEHHDTLALSNDQKRKEIIDEVFAEIKEVAEEAVKPDNLKLLP